YSDEMQAGVGDVARAVRANPAGFPAHLAVYFGPIRREDGTVGGNPARGLFNVVRVIGGATHEDLLMEYDAADRAQSGYPADRGQMISVQRDGVIVASEE